MRNLLLAISVICLAPMIQSAELGFSTITLSTPGPDLYADGTPVLDGEVYALVWSVDGDFNGFTADGRLVDANDRLVAALPLAEGGKCPEVVVSIADGSVPDGWFGIVLLDTRRFTDGVAAVSGVDANGGLTIVNATAMIRNARVEGRAPVPADATTPVLKGASVGTAVPAGVPDPVITDVRVDGNDVILTVGDTVGCINYAVRGSATPGGETEIRSVGTGSGGTITIAFPKKGDTGFFRVIRR